MHRVPKGPKFGGPEIALLFLALAFAVPMTAWWYGLYQQQADSVVQRPQATPRVEFSGLPAGDNVRVIAGVGYIVDTSSGQSEMTLPSIAPGISDSLSARIPAADPNQALLFTVALIGIVAAGFYTMAVYPSLRR